MVRPERSPAPALISVPALCGLMHAAHARIAVDYLLPYNKSAQLPAFTISPHAALRHLVADHTATGIDVQPAMVSLHPALRSRSETNRLKSELPKLPLPPCPPALRSAATALLYDSPSRTVMSAPGRALQPTRQKKSPSAPEKSSLLFGST